MKIYKISLSNAVIYSIISLVYISIFLYTGRVGLGKSISSSFPLVCFTVLGIIILIISSIVQMAIVSIIQIYDKFYYKQLLNKILIELFGVTILILIATLIVTFFNVNAKLTLYIVSLTHWIFITILEINFIIQLKNKIDKKAPLLKLSRKTKRIK
ncbi:hypothetical protein [Thomasclavelia cocleata]|uniref:hypothetical protein n=1 Tax=Thomasclavelia cocleata TaxID=69824 RepID=UPI0025A9B2B9|nr:hypothetical protein [Thomasclavelia cocleata]